MADRAKLNNASSVMHQVQHKMSHWSIVGTQSYFGCRPQEIQWVEWTAVCRAAILRAWWMNSCHMFTGKSAVGSLLRLFFCPTAYQAEKNCKHWEVRQISYRANNSAFLRKYILYTLLYLCIGHYRIMCIICSIHIPLATLVICRHRPKHQTQTVVI